MLSLTFKQINKSDGPRSLAWAIEVVLRKVFPSKKGSVTTMYWLGRIKDKIEAAVRHGSKEHFNILKRHVELNEKGEVKHKMTEEIKNEAGEIVRPATLVRDHQGHPIPIFKSEAEEELYEKEFEEFLSLEACSVKCDKIKIEQIKDLPDLTGELLYWLDPILDPEGIEEALENLPENKACEAEKPMPENIVPLKS